MKKRIGLIGFGTMGSAIYERAGNAFDFLIYEKDPSKTAAIPAAQKAAGLGALISAVDAVVLAVKPQDFPVLLGQMGGAGAAVVISIAAGITTAAIEDIFPGAHVIRVMPNLPAKVGRGMSCIARGKKVAQPDMTIAEQLFKKVGQILVIDESLMNAATAISGSGPGFFFDQVDGKSIHEAENYGRHIFTPQLAEAARAVGFLDTKQAAILAQATTAGALELLKTAPVSARELCRQVSSKGGTTEAGLKALHETNSLVEAAKAALARAKELAQ
jgi:pyrroline-5-carboxylate reductase